MPLPFLSHRAPKLLGPGENPGASHFSIGEDRLRHCADSAATDPPGMIPGGKIERTIQNEDQHGL